MLIADTYVGSLADDNVAARVDTADPLRVVLDDTERRRSRVRATTVDGTDLGIIIGRKLQDKDVLVARDNDQDSDDYEQLIVIKLDAIPAVALSFDDVNRDMLPAAVALGHAVGNRHRDLTVGDDRILIRAEQDRDRLESLLAAHLPDGATATQTTVSPADFGSDVGHTHSSEQSHTSSDDHVDNHTDHSHSHEHVDDTHQHARDEIHDNQVEDNSI